MKKNKNNAFTAIEILVSVSIIIVLAAIVLSAFINFKFTKSLDRDTELVVEVLRQARNQTLASQNAYAYGVHFETTSIVLFTGTSYDPASSTNKTYSLNSADTILSKSLAGGGSDVIFDRLTGETSENGTITLSSQSAPNTKTVTIYKTGIIE